MVMMVMMVVLCAVSSMANAKCNSDIPTDGKVRFSSSNRNNISDYNTSNSAGTHAIQLSMYSNSGGGSPGDDCPVACDSSNRVMEQFYQIAATDASCKQWPGHSGTNSMKNGVCHTSEKSFTYDQWTNCNCSGTIGASKKVYVNRCVVDTPNKICSKITDYTACESDIKESSDMTGHTVTWTTYSDDTCTTLCPRGGDACSTTLDLTLECNQNTASSQNNITCEADKITYNNYPETGSNSGNPKCVDSGHGVFVNVLPVGVCTHFPGPVDTWKLIEASTYNCTGSSPSTQMGRSGAMENSDTSRLMLRSIKRD